MANISLTDENLNNVKLPRPDHQCSHNQIWKSFLLCLMFSLGFSLLHISVPRLWYGAHGEVILSQVCTERVCTFLVKAMRSSYGIKLCLCSPTFICDLDQWEGFVPGFHNCTGCSLISESGKARKTRFGHTPLCMTPKTTTGIPLLREFRSSSPMSVALGKEGQVELKYLIHWVVYNDPIYMTAKVVCGAGRMDYPEDAQLT